MRVKLLETGWRWVRSPKPPLTPPQDIFDSLAELDVDWQPCSSFPSEIHKELLAIGLISDPFLGVNEESVQWVGETDWLYETAFSTPPAGLQHQDLVFEGLDTVGSVFLNGMRVLECDNMFRTFRVSVDHALQPEGCINTLLIIFSSAFLTGKKLESDLLGEGNHRAAWNGDPSRLYLRKAAYHYGWDWGPKIMTVGPWKPIRLESYTARIDSFWARPDVSNELLPSLIIQDLEISRHLPTATIVIFRLFSPCGEELRTAAFPSNDVVKATSLLRWTFNKDEVKLWWSTGLGEQPLYCIAAELVNQTGDVLHQLVQKVGFRRLRLVQEPLVGQGGTSFCFEINNVPIFCGGSNWIPIDSFLTTATSERYRSWLELLVAGNQNMVRVWGGGIYENDIFYEICDGLGILVWQDFLFACGAYPAHPSFLENVKAEASDNLQRIRHHPCLAILAGNNEDYQVAEQEHLQYNPDDHHGDWSKTDFPAREIYESVLPKIVHLLTDTFYHRGSPWGGRSTVDPTVGDTHQWNVWHGTQEPYQKWDELSSRFVSEFGMQGLPDIRTINHFLDGSKRERFPQSKMIGYHNKATGYERRQALYLIENVRFSFDLEGYAYATQLVQAECLGAAYRLWRRNFRGPGEAYTAGALVWQLNEVYPCISWSIVDYFRRPKAAFYAIKKALAPVAVGIRRYTVSTASSTHSAIHTDKYYAEMWACSSRLSETKVTAVLEAYDIATGERIYHQEWDHSLKPNQSTELVKLEVPRAKVGKEGDIVLVGKVLEQKGRRVIAKFSSWPEPLKFIQFATPKLVNLRVTTDWRKQTITAIAARPVKGLLFSFSEDVRLSDNALDLVPGEKHIIVTKGLSKSIQVKWRYLGDAHCP